ncbi:MAG: LysR family transcriptional regulator [Myxococcales bacterium]|nr:LysR family transcriptional regulator [Myxococcales bacterium]USN50191.1 MAG: LysR family transcriptional regulator [Myxococcales bacterium]
MMPQAMDLKYFLTVCKSKNISRASELLGLAQPSLSLAIKRLENFAGTPLFIRSKSGVEITKAGQLFKERSHELLSLWENLCSDIKKQSDLVSGRYFIGTHIALAIRILPPILTALMSKYPNLEISLVHDLSRVITDRVISFDIDFAIVVNPTYHPDLVIREFQSDQVGLYVQAKNYNKDTLILDPDLLQSQNLLNSIKKRGLDFKRTITTSSLGMVNALVKAGAGVGILPGRIKSPELELLDVSLPQIQDSHCLIYRADNQTSNAARVLKKELMQLLVDGSEIQR